MSTDRDLVITRDIAVPRDKLYRCWTEPELIKQWFAPKPWTTPHAETDVRAGGASLMVMRGPDGQEFRNHGVYLKWCPTSASSPPTTPTPTPGSPLPSLS